MKKITKPTWLDVIASPLGAYPSMYHRFYCADLGMDSLLSIASLRHGSGKFCLPTIGETNMSVTGIYHPLIQDCVTNDLDTSDNSILLTASNMSGKTSFIRAIGINMITGLIHQ